MMIFIILGLLMVIGCAGPTMQISPEQAMTQITKKENRSDLQNQMLKQIGQASVTSYRDYVVGPEDLLEVTFYGQKELGREVRVNGNGEITLPLVGALKVSELSPQEIENRLVELYKDKRFIKNPQVAVFVKEYRHQRVMVTGAVNNPGSYEEIGPRTLLEMLGKAGGLKENAGNVVHIVRNQSYSGVNKAKKQGAAQSLQPYPPGSDITEIDLNQLMNEGAMALNVSIKNGDVIHVPFAKSAYVLGAVNKPGNVPVRNNLTVTQAVAMAGGVNPLLASNQISIMRFDKGQRIKIPVDMSRIAAGENIDIRLKEDDVVFVQESGFKRFLYIFRVLNPIPIAYPVY